MLGYKAVIAAPGLDIMSQACRALNSIASETSPTPAIANQSHPAVSPAYASSGPASANTKANDIARVFDRSGAFFAESVLSDIAPPETSTRRLIWPTLILITAAIIPRLLLYIDRIRLYHATGTLYSLGGSDVPGWLGMAAHLSSSWRLDYWLMGARPPLFPISVALVYRAGGGIEEAAALQMLFGVLTVLSTYLLARLVFERTAQVPHPQELALLAGLLMAFDPATLSASVTLMAEPLFNLLFTLTLTCLALYLRQDHWYWLLAAALSLAGAMATRPTAIYFWLAAPLIAIPLVKTWWKPVLALALTGLLVYLGWSWNISQNHGVFTYSLQTNFSLLYLRALSAERLATGVEATALQDEYTREVYRRVGDLEKAANVEPDVTWWAMLVAESPQVYSAMGALAREKLIEYWPYALLGTPIGLARLIGVTQAYPRWFYPVEITYHILLYSAMLWGAWRAWQNRAWWTQLFSGIPILYVTGLTLVSQTSAMDTRMRSPMSASIMILAAYGLSHLWALWQARQANQGPTATLDKPHSEDGA